MGMSEQIQNQQKQAEKWFKELRKQMVGAIQKVDGSTFQENEWQRPGGGGGLITGGRPNGCAGGGPIAGGSVGRSIAGDGVGRGGGSIAGDGG